MAVIAIGQIETQDEIDAVRALVRDLVAYALTQDPGAAEADAFKGLEDQLAALPGQFGPPDGAFLLATADGAPAGCVAHFSHGDGVCEMKRMYVRPEFRGLKLGEALVEALMARARAQGFRRMVLDSFHTLKPAHHLYEKAGFSFRAPPADLPEKYRGKIVFMERDL